MVTVSIRSATQQDYSQIIHIGQSATTDFGLTVEDLHHWDRAHKPINFSGRLVAVTPSNEIVGTASYGQSAPEADPQRFNIWLFVLPAFQGHGIGNSLYGRILAELAPHTPRLLETGVRSDLLRATRFLQERQFAEVMRECETHIDLITFNPDKFVEDVKRVEAEGISIKRLTELVDDPERDHKLYELHQQRRAIGMEQGEPLPPFAEWQVHFWQRPRLLPNGFCIASAEGQYIGQSNALSSGVPAEIEYGYTGVLPAYRNRGIARAMKVYVLQWAKAQGYTLARSYSDSRNESMIRVNLHLGAIIQPPVLWMHKIL